MGWSKIGREGVLIVIYTDDIVLLAKDEKGMRSMIGRLEECLEGKGLELNTNKSR